MKPTTALVSSLALAAAALALGACGGPKRPPAVATANPTAGPETGAETQQPTPEPVEAGPDIRAVQNEGLGSGELTPETFAAEGGPLADIRFAFDEASLSDEARAVLEKHALWLQTHRDLRVVIEGHCDERGTVEYNLALGDQRARAARDYLVSLGVAPERLTTVSYGKERPLDPGHTEEAWARNRRDHFVVKRP